MLCFSSTALELRSYLATKAVKNGKSRLCLLQFQNSPFFTEEWCYYSFNTPHHGLLVWPVVVTVPDIPTLWNFSFRVSVRVFHLYISCGGKYSPDIVTARTAFLSSLLQIVTTFLPLLFIVHWPVGTKWRAVWSQLRMSSWSAQRNTWELQGISAIVLFHRKLSRAISLKRLTNLFVHPQSNNYIINNYVTMRLRYPSCEIVLLSSWCEMALLNFRWKRTLVNRFSSKSMESCPGTCAVELGCSSPNSHIKCTTNISVFTVCFFPASSGQGVVSTNLLPVTGPKMEPSYTNSR